MDEAEAEQAQARRQAAAAAAEEDESDNDDAVPEAPEASRARRQVEESVWESVPKVGPSAVRLAAMYLGINVSSADPDVAQAESRLLPVTLAMMRATIPSGWREVRRKDDVLFEEVSTSQSSKTHPLASHLGEVVRHERAKLAERVDRQPRPGEMPQWV
jgi:hypothetical protein